LVLSVADKGWGLILSGNRLAPIDTLAEPKMDENPLPNTLNTTEPVNAGLEDATETGESASNEMVETDETLNKAQETRTCDERIVPEATLQFVEESEIHLDDSQEQPDRDINCVIDVMPKREPMTDNETEPVLAALKNAGELT
jgi:hypothetical protein